MKNIFKKVLSFLLTWNEIISIPFALLLWAISPWLIRTLDPTAAVYDGGIFQIILFTIIQFLIYHGLAWIMIKISFPGLYKFLDDDIEKLFFNSQNNLSLWEKSKLVLWLFSLYLLCIVLLSRVL